MRYLILLIIFCLSINLSYADESLREMFLNNKAIIYGINIRNFNAEDKDNNGLIEHDEISGTFLNAIERLDELKVYNINTLHVLPITPVGKLKALGTAGSLYAMDDFASINPQFVDKNSDLLPEEQVKKFIDECHKRGIKVIIDLPSCGSYDLFLKQPELFLKDENNLSIIPTDWTDVRLFNVLTNGKLNQDVLAAHYKFIDMILEAGADGLRADVATIKPFEFWVNLISYTRAKSPEFFFLAEASDSWREPPSEYAPFTPYDRLLEAGFDGYYGSFFNLKDWKNQTEIIEHIRFNKKLLDSYKDKKNVILSFTTHDEISPVILHGENFSVMISWLEATLPFNPYVIDGFYYGADYIYPWGNTKAGTTATDDDYYFVHRGKLDIFNFSAKPVGKSVYINENYKNAMQFRADNLDLISKGEFMPLVNDNSDVFSYARIYNDKTLIVVGNLNYKNSINKITIRIPGLNNKNNNIKLIKGNKGFKIAKNKLITGMKQGEIKVLLINNFSL